MNDVHANKYILIYVMRHLLFEVDVTTEFIEQELRFHKRFLIEEFDHGSD